MDALVTPEEQREATRLVAGELAKHGLEVLVLGSVAVLLRVGGAVRTSSTKDVDMHAFPVGDVVQYWDILEASAKNLHGSMRMGTDGAAFVLHVPVQGRDVPVEIIEGNEDFIPPMVLVDAVETAIRIDGVWVPTWEHIAVMKAEAWFDRTGDMKRKYLEDLATLAGHLRPGAERLNRSELKRLVAMREERKRQDMLLTLERVFAGLVR